MSQRLYTRRFCSSALALLFSSPLQRLQSHLCLALPTPRWLVLVTSLVWLSSSLRSPTTTRRLGSHTTPFTRLPGKLLSYQLYIILFPRCPNPGHKYITPSISAFKNLLFFYHLLNRLFS
ncbi:hypothetical protein M441DRAFT_382009 [Trichoderma asperellum CBS 433.97]|uniref:Uncharacterized protein n=1 Tax=Trichoderma asperellum (strain ATCC 204424 / CBS 433.97 / NBRC 101777) TaxID=1042311 RepID=A0A2T3ZB80_TRIA4|nr:hypothetical protein M441DRAFT_382009 [Trichoderma asperellum CBS 433.97]PTB42065.1 hypothetical protein M441DRAFT_382009 [Trichoderma asperellum CBS 433.97]WVH32631.1 hypothetical protein [Trichoderma asperellum]